MRNNIIKGFVAFGLICFGPQTSRSQMLTCAEIQGQTEISPYEGQQVTVSGKVTEFFGDVWYIQDDYGAWNGLLCVGPNVVIDPNPPWWNDPRQPEVGDVLELTGTIVEADGNTQLMDITEYVFIDFWNATAAGVGVTVAEMMDESLEGTRARLESVTVMTAPDGSSVWTVSDATGTATIIGVDVDDPGNNEDADGPTPGDVYRVYGAVRQIGDDYVLDLGDIDTLSLVVGLEELETALSIYPNPATDLLNLAGIQGDHAWSLMDALGRPVMHGSGTGSFQIDVSTAPSGRYTLQVIQDGGTLRQAVLID